MGPARNIFTTTKTTLALGLAGLVLAMGVMPSAFVPISTAQASEVGVSATVELVAHHYVIKLQTDDASPLERYGVNLEHKFTFSKSASFANIYSFDSAVSLADLRTLLAGKFVYLEQDPEVNLGDISVTPIPNDPGFTSSETDINNQWGLAKAKFDDAWSKTTGSTSVVVAVIDTGIDETHRDMRGGHFKAGYDLISNTTIPVFTNSDDNGHGTLVSGVIAATPNNGIGIAGSVWQATLMPVKALDKVGSGTSSSVAEAIVWATDHSAQIINMSLGGIGFSHDTTLANAVSYAYGKNVIVISAAGNDAAANGGNLDIEPVFPICDDNGQNMIIGVTATDYNDVKPDFANYGKVCVDVAAPGKRILSTINFDPITGASAPNAYAYASGTSLSVPFVTGQAILLKARNPEATNKQIRDRIISSADKIDELNLSQCNGGSCRGLLGAGRINAMASLATDIAILRISDGDVVRVGSVGQYYYISGGKRHPISPFVQQQRFASVIPKVVEEDDLSNFPEGDYAAPLDGTLIKMDNSPVIYYMYKGIRLPITYQVFLLQKFNFADVRSMSYSEVNSWLQGSFLTPPEGTLLRTGKNPTVYWVVGQTLHPINYNFYVSRGLQIFPVVYVADDDIKSFSKGDAYIK